MSAWDDHKKKKGYVAETKQTETSPSRQEGEASAWDRHKASAAGQATQSQLRQTTVNNEIAAKKGKNALRYQKSQLQTSTPSDADWAGYYAKETAYNSQYGKPWQAENSYQRYKAALNRVTGYYDKQLSGQNHYVPAMTKEQVINYTGKRYAEQAPVYEQMARDAAALGDKDLYDRAKKGYDDLAGNYSSAYAAYIQAMNDDYKQRMGDLEKSDKGRYLYQTTSKEDVAKQVKSLQTRQEELKAQMEEADLERRSMWNNPDLIWYDDRGRFEDNEAYREYDRVSGLYGELQAEEERLEQELAQYQRAQDLYDYDDYLALREQLSPGGGMTQNEWQRLRDEGERKYRAVHERADKEKQEAKRGVGDTLLSGLSAYHALKMEKKMTEIEEDAGVVHDLEEARHLNTNDADIFFVLYAQDPEKAAEFIHTAKLQRDDEFQQYLADSIKDNPYLRWTAGMQGGAVAHLIGGAANLLDPYSETALEINRVGNALSMGAAQGAEEHGIFNTGALAGKIDDNIPVIGDILGGKGLGDAYQLGTSMVESGLTAAAAAAVGDYGDAVVKVVEFLGTAIMGSSAAASDYDECIKRGLDRQQAMVHATSAGIAEAAFEYISLDKLVNQNVTRGFVKNFFLQGGIEASEEACTTIANRITDGILARQMGYDSSIEQRVKELMALGVDRKEAEDKAEREWLTELFNDAIGGFISGGFMTAGNTAMNWREYKAAREQNRMEGQMTRQSGQADALRQYAEANDLGWYGREIDEEAVKSGVGPVQNVETGERIATPPSEARNDSQKQTRQEKRQERQAQRELKRQLREQTQQDRQIGSDTQRVQAHIQEQFAGKSIQEQTQLRDQMIRQYGNGIAPSVYEAISVEAAKKAASLKSADEIRAARDQAVNETQDRAMKRAIADGYDQAVFGQAMRSGNADEAGRYFQQLRNTGEGGMTLEATVKDQDGQSRQIAITGMTEDGKGVKLADGSTVTVSKLRADADTMDAVQRIAELEMGTDADAVLQAYIKADKQGVDGYRWLMDYSLAYEQGRTNKLSLEEAVKRSSLDQRTVMEAYTLGQREAHQSTKSAVEALKAMPKKAGITGKTSNIDTSEIEGITLNESEREQFEFANKVFSLIGVDVKWVASAVKNGRFVGANGSYLNGVVTLDVHAGRNFIDQVNSGVLATMGHELTHFLQQYAPEQYQALKEFLFRQIVQSSANGETRLERLIWEKQRRASSKLSRKAAEDEVVADACQTMLRDSKAIREFAQQDEEAAKGIVRWLDKWFGKLKQAFSRSAQLTEEARFVDGFAQEVREAFGQLWDEALREAVETHDRVGNLPSNKKTAQEGGEQNMDRSYEDYDKPITISDVMQLRSIGRKSISSFTSEDLLKAQKWAYKFNKELGDKSPFFRAWFGEWRSTSTTPVRVSSVPIYEDTKEFRKKKRGVFTNADTEWNIRVSHEGESNTISHAGDNRLSEYGLAGIKSLIENAVLLDTEVHEHHKNNAKNDRIAFDHRLYALGKNADGTTALYRITVEDQFADPKHPSDKRFHNLKYIQKVADNIDSLTHENKARGAESASDASATKYSVADVYGFVKQYDADFNVGSEPSKVTNADGSPQIVYHGTNADFTVFDENRIGENYRLSTGGFYFRSTNDVGYYGDKTIAAYLRIEKPLEYYADDGFYNAEDYFDVNPWDKVYYAKSEGCDGIIVHHKKGDMFLVFDRGQIKSATDNIGTFDRNNPDIRYSERNYDLPSDLELMDRAIEGLSEAGGEEYWKALLESDPGLAEDVKGYKDQAKKLAAAEKRLADYKKQMQLGGNRKLNTRGIPSLSLEMMKDLGASDAKGRGVAKQVTQTLTAAYQKALDAIDKGTSDADAWDIVYNEGVVPAAEIIAKQGTHSEKTGRGWITTSLESYYGEGGMQAIIDTMAGYVGADYALNRYRKAIQPTVADRIVERTEKRMQKQVDAATDRATEAERINKKLTEDRDFWKNQQAKDSETVTFLNERLKEARQDLRDNKSLSSQERRKLAARIKSLQTQLQAKREEIRALKSLSQQLDKQAVEFGQKQAKLLDKLEQQVQRERDILAGKLKPLGMQRLLKAEREKAAAKAEQHKDEVFANYKERQQQAKLRGRIKNLSDEMKRRMTNPSERAYVPASLYGSMTKLADVLDGVLAPGTGTKAEAKYRSMMDAIHGLAREYSAVKDLDDPTYSSEYDEEIQEAISDIERILERKDASWIDQLTGDTQKGLRELETGELQRIYELMRQINYAMVGATAMLGHTQFKDVYAAMRSVADQQNGMKALNSLNRMDRWNRTRLLNNLSVMRAAEMMSDWDRGAALYQLMHGIEQGADDSWTWVMDYNKAMEPLKTGKNEKEYRQALTKQLDFGITDKEGQKVTMTKLQALQILMTAEREAHNNKLLHLQTGGAVIRNATDLQNGKGAKARSQTIEVTPKMLQQIQNGLTAWDRSYMKTIRDYFQREGKRTNEILYKLKHKVLQTEEFYIPYNVDKNYLETNLDEQQAMSMWVKQPGSTNALKANAKQPVIIDGMDTVMARHVKEIGDYVGMAIPIRDFSKVYNGLIPTGEDNPLPVKETIDRTFGKEGQHLLTQAVIDVQGGTAKQNWSSGISEMLNKLHGSFVKSALLINPSVTIKQAASYIAAESVLSHRALVMGNRATFSSDASKSPALIAYLFANPEGKTARRIYNEIDQHTSLHYQRRLGMSQAEIAEQANRNGPIKRRMNAIGANMEQSKFGHAVRRAGENLNPVTWIQRMDVATTATLWVACKEQAKLDGMKAGTAEFWQRTTELYERCLRETQPMYDGLHRTANQKQAGGLMQYLFPFRTVPIQNHGQLAASYEALKASKNKSKAEQAAARKFFAKTVWAQTESAFVFSMMTFLAAALKRKTKKYRDEDEEFTAGSFAKGLLTDVGSTLFSVLQPMYGSELVSLMSRAADKFEGNSGYTYDAISVGLVDMLNDLASSGDKLVADAGKLIRGEDVSGSDFWNHSAALLLKGAKLAGIPADTVKTYIAGAKGNVQDIIEGRIPALNDESWDRATGVNAKRFFEAWEAGDEAKMQTVLNEVQRSGKSEDSIASAFNKAAKDAYENNGLSLEQYADYLDKTGMFDAEKISGKIKNLVRDEFQAGERSEDEAISALTGICGMDEDAAWKTVQRWEAGAEHDGEEDYSYSQYEDLREALDAGKSLEDAGKEYLAHGYTEEQIVAQAVSWLKDQVTAGKINEDRAIQLLRQYKGMDADKAWKKVQEWKAKAEHAEDEDYSWSQYDEIDAAIDGNKDIGALVKQLTSHGVEEKSVTSHVKSYLIQRYEDKALTESQFRNQLSRYCGIVAKKDVDEIVNNANCFRDSGFHYSELKTAYNAKELTGDKARQMLTKYGGMSAAEAKAKTRYWDFEVKYPDANLSIEKVNAYYDTRPANYGKTMEQAGISVQSYISYCQQASKATGTDKDGDGRTDSGSKKAAIMKIIDSLNLTRSQKDALYYLNNWSQKTISEAPWH